MIFAPEVTVSLTFGCGCAESWQVHQVPDGEVVDQRTAEPCIPANCPTCIEFGRPCPTRMGMAPAYHSVEFSEVVPSRRVHYRRAKGA